VSEDWVEVAAWLAAQADEVVETSCARVFLTGDRAWKIKRPVDLGFLDFSTLGKRKWALDRELDLNRRWSGDIYRAVRAVTRERGGLAIGGAGEAVEWLLEMRRFDPRAVLAERPEALNPARADDLGRLIARFHIDAPLAPEADFGAYGYTVDANEGPLTRAAPPLDLAMVARVIRATKAGRDALTPLLEVRRTEGFARLAHGDLHLGNILLEDGHPLPFDCIEFSQVLGRMDVLYDAAFPIMDLVVRGQPAAANRLLNAYLDEAARGFPPSLWDGMRALPQFLAVRACVRAHVVAHQNEAAAARAYLAAAESFLTLPAPRLTAVGGLSGSGKTWEAARLAAREAPGAVILRSDLIRKRLWNGAPLERLPAAAYAPAEDERVHREMFNIARRVLAAGWPVILDATFLDPARRTEVEALAAGLGVPFEGLWLDVPPEVLRARVAARTGDASDADLDVLERQLARGPGRVTWRRLSLQSEDER
jgi:aminoglycoside phosphotransferase family enzyme/predicted kinase